MEFCKKNDILLLAYNSLCKGKYTKSDLNKEVSLNLLEEKLVIELSEKYNKTPGQIVLNWAISQNVAVIPASGNSSRVIQNFESANFRLNEEDLKRFESLNVGYRFLPGKLVPNQFECFD